MHLTLISCLREIALTVVLSNARSSQFNACTFAKGSIQFCQASTRRFRLVQK